MRNFEDLNTETKRRLMTEFLTGKLSFSDIEELNNVKAETVKFAITDYVLEQWEIYNPPAPIAPTATPTLWEQLKDYWARFRESFGYDLLKLIVLCGTLIVAFVSLPTFIHENFEIDPLSNLYISNGFTALYVLVFGIFGINLVLLVIDRKTYLYLNPSERTNPDYTTELFSQKPLIRCLLIPFKYYFYLFLFVLVLMYVGKGLVPE